MFLLAIEGDFLNKDGCIFTGQTPPNGQKCLQELCGVSMTPMLFFEHIMDSRPFLFHFKDQSLTDKLSLPFIWVFEKDSDSCFVLELIEPKSSCLWFNHCVKAVTTHRFRLLQEEVIGFKIRLKEWSNKKTFRRKPGEVLVNRLSCRNFDRGRGWGKGSSHCGWCGSGVVW